MDRPLSPQDALAARFKNLRRVVDDLKVSAQPVGSGSVVMQRVFTPAPYDIEVASVGFRNRVVRLTFTPDDTSVDYMGVPYRMSWTSTQSDTSIIEVIAQRLDPEPQQQQWLLFLSGNDSSPTAWMRLKFYIFASGGGGFQAELI